MNIHARIVSPPYLEKSGPGARGDNLSRPVKGEMTKAIVGLKMVSSKGKVVYDLLDFAGKKALAEYKLRPYSIEREDGETFTGESSKFVKFLPYNPDVEEIPF